MRHWIFVCFVICGRHCWLPKQQLLPFFSWQQNPDFVQATKESVPGDEASLVKAKHRKSVPFYLELV